MAQTFSLYKDIQILFKPQDAKAKLTLQLNNWYKVMRIQKTCSVQELTICKINSLFWEH